MPILQPFRAVRYSSAKFPDLTPLLTPPYDVISATEQADFYARHPHNMIRLDLGQQAPTDTASDSRYRRAARWFHQWRSEQILIQDEDPSVYPASIHYRLATGEAKTLLGLFGLVRLEAFQSGQVLPHEWTFAAAKQDRLQLLRECWALFSPIFFLTADPQGRMRPLLEEAIKSAPTAGQAVAGAALTGADPTEQADQPLQQVWKVSDPALVEEFSSIVKASPLLIADGHHRYETSLNFQREWAARSMTSAQPAPADYCLAFIAARHDPGLSILPTHRVLSQLPAFDGPTLLDRLNERFSIRTVRPASSVQAQVQQLLITMQQRGQSQPTLGMVCQGMTDLMVLTDNEPAAAQLDVRILQSEILEPLLGVHEEEAVAAGQLRYVKDPLEAAQLVRKAEAQAAFFLNPTPIDAIETIARSGGRMPRKTTYFLPKPLTGFVIYALDSLSLAPSASRPLDSPEK